MKTMMASLAIVLGLATAAVAQDGKRERERGEKGKEAGKEKEAMIGLRDVDTNNDGKASFAELRVALTRLLGKEPERKKGDGAVGLKDLDTNGDGKATVKELQVAMELLSAKKEGGDKKEGGEKREGK